MFQKEVKLKECIICHYWYFIDIGYKFAQYVCTGCNDIPMIAYDLKNIAMLNLKSVTYRSILWNMTENDAINKLSNFKLDNKGTL